MKTDAEILLGLIGEDCCCDCCEEEAEGLEARARQKATPARPQMNGKRMLPLDIPVTEQPFVPALYPERETPQLPEPGHRPIILPEPFAQPPTGRVYSQEQIFGETGFEYGLMLDSGELDQRYFGEINHATRLGRMWSGHETSLIEYSAPPYGVRISTAAGIANIPPATPAVTTTLHTFMGTTGGSTAPALAQVEDAVLVEVIGFGRCLRGVMLGQFNNTVPVNAVQTNTRDEDPSRHFDGAADTYPPVSAQTTGSPPGTLTRTKMQVDTDQIATGSPNSTTAVDISQVQALFDSNDPLLRGFRNSWLDANNDLQVRDWIVTTTNVPPTVRKDLTYGSAPELGGPGYFSASYAIHPDGAAAQENLYLTFGNPIPGAAHHGTGHFRDGTACEWQEYAVLSFVFMPDDFRLPSAQLPLPPVSFQSPTLNGKAFIVSLTDRTQRDKLALEPECSLLGMKVNISGGPDLLGWRSFASFRSRAGGITLLLDTPEQLAITPELDATRATNVQWTDLLAEWGLTGTPSRLGGHLGHHSYPEDRAYLLLEHPFDFQWVAFGEWDAYRDVSAETWAALGLSKPRTRQIFEAGLARTPPIATPPRPAHGLALFDVFAPILGAVAE